MLNLTPDVLYEEDSITTIYVPADDLLIHAPYSTSHNQMYLEQPFEIKKKIFKTYYQKYDVLPKIRTGHLSEDGLNPIIAMMKYSDAICGRIQANEDYLSEKGSAEVAMWPTRTLNFLREANIVKMLKAIKRELSAYLNKNSTNKFTVSIPTQAMKSIEEYDEFPTNEVVLDLKTLKKSYTDQIENLNKKNYVIDGGTYTLEQLKALRANMHILHGMNYKHPILCKIDLELYPELIGFKPTTCDEKITLPSKTKINWRTTSEALKMDFKKLIDINL